MRRSPPIHHVRLVASYLDASSPACPSSPPCQLCFFPKPALQSWNTKLAPLCSAMMERFSPDGRHDAPKLLRKWHWATIRVACCKPHPTQPEATATRILQGRAKAVMRTIAGNQVITSVAWLSTTPARRNVTPHATTLSTDGCFCPRLHSDGMFAKVR